MTPAQLRDEAERHDQDANYWAGVAAGHWGHAAYCRNIGDIDQAEIYEIRARAAEKSEQRALGLAAFANHAAAQLEGHAARTADLTAIGRAA